MPGDAGAVGRFGPEALAGGHPSLNFTFSPGDRVVGVSERPGTHEPEARRRAV